jgi:hypothetical protein
MAHDVHDGIKFDARFLEFIRALVGIFQLHGWQFLSVDRAKGVLHLRIE